MNRVTAILPAAGLGTRMGAETPKQFLELDGVPVLLFTLRRLAACQAITDFVISTRPEDFRSWKRSMAERSRPRISAVESRRSILPGSGPYALALKTKMCSQPCGEPLQRQVGLSMRSSEGSISM